MREIVLVMITLASLSFAWYEQRQTTLWETNHMNTIEACLNAIKDLSNNCKTLERCPN